ncbi:hypothetical protein [Ruegeria arenilitoris]|uniref:hypothetical protein n=1 Tax=Ruegeria arenilitoris TaxID=1173585 RepID=UPI001480EDDA|nr:hypothetical protein [Ruegeria arenilitoris]
MTLQFDSNQKVGLDRLGYLAFFFSTLVTLGLIQRWLDFEWPFQTLPLSIAMVFSASLYGMAKGTRGKSLGSTFKSWIIARQMVLTVMFFFLVILSIFYLLGEVPRLFVNVSRIIELTLCILISFVFCRYAFILGVNKGYSAFLKKENHKL